jgi:pilus assembly protein Flp/PilA
MTQFMTRLWKQEEGQDMAEYAIMLGVIAAVVIGVIVTFAGQTTNVFTGLVGKF